MSPQAPALVPVDAVAWPLAAALRDLIRTALREAIGTPPASFAVIPGRDVAIDDCCAGQAWVRIVRVYPTTPGEFPNTRTTPLGEGCDDGTWWAVELGAGTARCAPCQDDAGRAPSDTDQEHGGCSPTSRPDPPHRAAQPAQRGRGGRDRGRRADLRRPGRRLRGPGAPGHDHDERVRGGPVKQLNPGDAVSVRALIAMPGIADRQIIHTRWDAELVTLVAAGAQLLAHPEPPAIPEPIPAAAPPVEVDAATTATDAADPAPADAQVRRKVR
jgi:hypothetical protein